MKDRPSSQPLFDQVPGRARLYVLGLLSLILFWLPLLAPVIQFAAVVECLRVARWGVASPLSLAAGLSGALIGFILFLALEFFWVI